MSGGQAGSAAVSGLPSVSAHTRRANDARSALEPSAPAGLPAASMKAMTPAGSSPVTVRAAMVADHVVLTESALGGQEVAIAFKPRREWPKAFRFLRLYK